MTKRPITVTLIACLLILAGAVGFVYHFSELNPRQLMQNDVLWVELVRVLAIIAGAYLLSGRNWARWLAVAWIAFHVVIGALHSVQQAVIHLAILAVFVYCLFRPAANRYFAPSGDTA